MAEEPKASGDLKDADNAPVAGDVVPPLELEAEEVEDEEEDFDDDDTEVAICEEDPNFSTLCSFFFKFGSTLGLSYTIDELKVWLENTASNGMFSCLIVFFVR